MGTDRAVALGYEQRRELDAQNKELKAKALQRALSGLKDKTYESAAEAARAYGLPCERVLKARKAEQANGGG